MNGFETSDTSPGKLYKKLVELIDAGSELAAAVVLTARGSTPQVAGARAIIETAGRLWGTVGGGALEAKTLQAAGDACRTQRPCIFDFALNNHDASNEAAVCGGQMRVLLDPTVARHRACFIQAIEALANRRRGCLLTTISIPAEKETAAPAVLVEWLAEESVDQGRNVSLDENIRQCLQSGKAAYIALGNPVLASTQRNAIECLIEPVVPQPLLVIAGAGHVGRAVAMEAWRVGFDVTVIDDRPELAASEFFPPEVRVLCGPMPELISTCPLDEQSYVVLATRGHKHDAAVLAVCIRRRLTYLGMIGSQRKINIMRKRFLEGDLATEEEFDRVHAPIGIEIGAVTVPEIAVSIVAQLIAVRQKAAL